MRVMKNCHPVSCMPGILRYWQSPNGPLQAMAATLCVLRERARLISLA
jgi:hypothetical protein